MGRVVSGASAEDAAASSSGFKAYPAGEYIGKIIGTKEGKFTSANNKDKPKLNVEFKFTEAGPGEQYVGKKYTEFNVPLFGTWSSGAVAFLFYQFYEALGVKFPKGGGDVELPDDEDIWGEEVGIRIGQEQSVKDGVPQVDADGNPVMRNKTLGFFPASKGVKVTADADSDDTGFTL